MKQLLLKAGMILILSQSFGCLLAQQYHFRNWSVRDGVAQSQVYALLQDHRGYIWMGTRGGGVSTFDGQRFKTFTEKNGLANNYIYVIRQDADQHIWIGTNNGLSSYNGVAFHTYRPSGTEPCAIMDMTLDSRGRRWLATNQGLMIFERGKFRLLNQEANIPTGTVTSVLIDKQGKIWFGTGQGLYRITEGGGRFKAHKMGQLSRYLNNAITCIREHPNGQIWVGTYGDGVYIINGTQVYRPDLNHELYKQTVLDVYVDRQQKVWIATLHKGVCQYQAATHSFTWFDESEGLSNNHVRSILQDNTGSYWFGTSGGGVANYFGKQFTTYDQNTGLSSSFIYSVFRDKHERLWVGTGQRGLTCILDTGVVQFNASTGFQDVKVKALCESHDYVYVGTDGQGLFVYDSSGFVPLKGLERKYIRALLTDREGNVWVGTAGHGIYRLSGDPLNPELKNFTVNEGLLFNRVTALHEDRKGRIWYATETNGMGCIKDEKVTTIRLRTNEGLALNAIRSLTEDRSGVMWAGTAGAGISAIWIYQQQPEIQNFSFKEGLTSANIYLLAVDPKNNLIVGSETGLDYLFLDEERKIKRIKHYGRGDGFSGVEACQNAVWNDHDGTIWFGSINGLSHYNPASLVRNLYEPILHISDVKLFYESLSDTPFKNLCGDWNQVKTLQLPYDQNHLSFEFQAVNLSNPEGVKYKWKLAGFDAEWSPASGEHGMVYSNLPSGNYRFLVKSCNEDGVWNKTPVEMLIHIATPYWQTIWFKVVVVSSVLLVLGLVFRWNTRRVRSQTEEERRKLQLEKDLVALEQKALRLQMNPHFIFNALNSIQALIGSGNEQQARYYLAKFSGLMRQILDNSRNTLITLQEEVKTLENYLMIEQFCNGNRFDYAVEVDPNLEADYLSLPPMLIQPFIENAIKHGMKLPDGESADESHRGFIKVVFTEKPGIIECTVTDNGIGRAKAAELQRNSKENYHKSTALEVTRERLDLFGDNDNELVIEDIFDQEGKAAGTRVTLKIAIG